MNSRSSFRIPRPLTASRARSLPRSPDILSKEYPQSVKALPSYTSPRLGGNAGAMKKNKKNRLHLLKKHRRKRSNHAKSYERIGTRQRPRSAMSRSVSAVTFTRPSSAKNSRATPLSTMQVHNILQHQLANARDANLHARGLAGQANDDVRNNRSNLRPSSTLQELSESMPCPPNSAVWDQPNLDWDSSYLRVDPSPKPVEHFSRHQTLPKGSSQRQKHVLHAPWEGHNKPASSHLSYSPSPDCYSSSTKGRSISDYSSRHPVSNLNFIPSWESRAHHQEHQQDRREHQQEIKSKTDIDDQNSFAEFSADVATYAKRLGFSHPDSRLNDAEIINVLLKMGWNHKEASAGVHELLQLNITLTAELVLNMIRYMTERKDQDKESESKLAALNQALEMESGTKADKYSTHHKQASLSAISGESQCKNKADYPHESDIYSEPDADDQPEEKAVIDDEVIADSTFDEQENQHDLGGNSVFRNDYDTSNDYDESNEYPESNDDDEDIILNGWSKRMARQCFYDMDSDNNGMLRVEELSAGLRKNAQQWQVPGSPEDYAKRLFAFANNDGDRYLTFVEWWNVLTGQTGDSSSSKNTNHERDWNSLPPRLVCYQSDLQLRDLKEELDKDRVVEIFDMLGYHDDPESQAQIALPPSLGHAPLRHITSRMILSYLWDLVIAAENGDASATDNLKQLDADINHFIKGKKDATRYETFGFSGPPQSTSGFSDRIQAYAKALKLEELEKELDLDNVIEICDMLGEEDPRAIAEQMTADGPMNCQQLLKLLHELNELDDEESRTRLANLDKEIELLAPADDDKRYETFGYEPHPSMSNKYSERIQEMGKMMGFTSMETGYDEPLSNERLLGILNMLGESDPETVRNEFLAQKAENDPSNPQIRAKDILDIMIELEKNIEQSEARIQLESYIANVEKAHQTARQNEIKQIMSVKKRKQRGNNRHHYRSESGQSSRSTASNLSDHDSEQSTNLIPAGNSGEDLSAAPQHVEEAHYLNRYGAGQYFCALCDAPATIRCDECDFYFCTENDCDASMHAQNPTHLRMKVSISGKSLPPTPIRQQRDIQAQSRRPRSTSSSSRMTNSGNSSANRTDNVSESNGKEYTSAQFNLASVDRRGTFRVAEEPEERNESDSELQDEEEEEFVVQNGIHPNHSVDGQSDHQRQSGDDPFDCRSSNSDSSGNSLQLSCDDYGDEEFAVLSDDEHASSSNRPKQDLQQSAKRTMCDLCEENAAVVYCADCGESYCRIEGCDEDVHYPPNRRNHKRYKI